MLRNIWFSENWFVFQEPLSKMALYFPPRNVVIAYFRYLLIQAFPTTGLIFFFQSIPASFSFLLSWSLAKTSAWAFKKGFHVFQHVLNFPLLLEIMKYMPVICVIAGHVSIDWLFSSLWFLFCYLFACLVIFYLMIDITNFILLDADLGGQSLNIVEFILICCYVTRKQFGTFKDCF